MEKLIFKRFIQDVEKYFASMEFNALAVGYTRKIIIAQ